MPPKEKETFEERIHRLETAADTLTQDQIDACAWVMGGDGVGWTKQTILNALSPLKYPLPIPNK